MFSEENLVSQNDSLIYIGDPMCSWCYGFGPVLDEIRKAKPYLPFKIICGGLRVDGQERFSELKSFLTHHWQEIGSITGMKFKYEILSSDQLFYNTEPACRAVVTIRTMSPHMEWAFFKKLQSAFYQDNINPVSTHSFVEIVKTLQLDAQKFERLFQSAEIKQKTRKDFMEAQQMGIRSFPTLLLKRGHQKTVLSQGYSDSKSILQKIKDAGI